MTMRAVAARDFYDKGMDNALFLRAERRADGVRTFRLIEGEPLQTSYGRDLYERVFADRIPAEARALVEPVPT